MSENTPVFILVGDSRLCGFEKFDYGKFKFHHVIKRGAVLKDLVSETLSILRDYQGSDRSIIVKIACGINEFTKFEYHKEGKNLRFRSDVSSQTVFDSLKSFKRKIKTEVPTSVVGIITVPTLSFLTYRNFRENKEKDKRANKHQTESRSGKRTHKSSRPDKSRASDKDLQDDQEKLDKELVLLNASIKLENSRKQTGLLKGCYTVSWHNSISRVSIRKRRSGSRKVVRNNFSELYDGLHPKQSLKKRWHNQLLKCATSELELIRQYKLKTTKVTFVCKS